MTPLIYTMAPAVRVRTGGKDEGWIVTWYPGGALYEDTGWTRTSLGIDSHLVTRFFLSKTEAEAFVECIQREADIPTRP